VNASIGYWQVLSKSFANLHDLRLCRDLERLIRLSFDESDFSLMLDSSD
jgi:hypothetical protein